MTPTEEQLAIVEAARFASESLMVEAYAGTAKTTTLALAAAAMRPSRALAVAFNAMTAAELKRRLAARTECRTFNALGYAAWRLAHPRVTSWQVDREKTGKLVTEALRGRKGARGLWKPVLLLVTAAQRRGIVVAPAGPPSAAERQGWDNILDEMPASVGEEAVELARKVLRADLALALGGTLSFDDMLWCPLHYGGRWTRWDTVFVDEAQDLSAENRRELAAGLRPASRMLVFGDSCQAIYAFRGADFASMASMRSLRPAWRDLRLTATFRCPQVIVRRQQGHAPGFRTAPGLLEGNLFVPGPWAWSDTATWLKACGGHSMAVLCRNNAPLFALALRLLRRQIPAVLTGRTLGAVLLHVIARLRLPPATAIASFLMALADWEEAETATAWPPASGNRRIAYGP
jgi:hypothetical protein